MTFVSRSDALATRPGNDRICPRACFRVPSCPSWFPFFFAATVTRPHVARPRSPPCRADSLHPMNELPDVAYALAPSHKVPTGAGGQLDSATVIRDQRFDIGKPSWYDSPIAGGQRNAASH